jgi:6-phosphofructokinase 1
MVDVSSESYRIAREYMIRLEPEDFGRPETLARLAAVAGVSPAEFRQRFASVARPSFGR